MAKAYITWLADVLREAGCTVREEGDWKNRDSPGDFQPIGVIWHHTAGGVASESTPAPSLGNIKDGVYTSSGDFLAGPLAHALLDYNGVFRVVSAGNANHAGTVDGSARGPIPLGDGNVTTVGWEIDYAAQEPIYQDISPAQYREAIKGTAAVLKRLGKDASYVRSHREIAPSRKSDPRGVNMDDVRKAVAELLAGGTSGGGENVYEQDISTQLLQTTDDAWYVMDYGARTYWRVTSSTLLQMLIQNLGMRITGTNYPTNILSGFKPVQRPTYTS